LTNSKTIYIATRGSPLALAQSNMILAQCQSAFPNLQFELKVIKTTGDKLQTASLAKEGHELPKGLFTKELEVALLKGEADLAVHSLKDLPTELPAGLKLGAVGKREDVRDVLIYRSARHAAGSAAQGRSYDARLTVKSLPSDAIVATSSTRRKAQLLALNPNLKVVEIRGNVLTRMQKLAEHAEMDATVLALAGITRLKFTIAADCKLSGDGVPDGLLASVLPIEDMLPCAGQGAIGIEVRENDEGIASVCERLNHSETYQNVVAERSFLAGMGGGCQSPVAAYAEVAGDQIRMRALSFTHGPIQRTEGKCRVGEALELGRQLAEQLR
jgi:hydroxymethylbilane synthase